MLHSYIDFIYYIRELIANIIDIESESCSSSVESAAEDDRVAFNISEQLKSFLELDHKMITKNDKLVNLPAKIPVVTILENFVKYQSIKSICGPDPADAPRRRNSAAKAERREKDFDKIKTRYESDMMNKYCIELICLFSIWPLALISAKKWPMACAFISTFFSKIICYTLRRSIKRTLFYPRRV